VARTAQQIAADILAFEPVEGDWRPLDSLLAELWQTGRPGEYVEELLRVFEKFADEDGAGVLWSIVHGLESLRGYEPALIRSVGRCPSHLGVMMIGRLLNSGRRRVGEVSLYELLKATAAGCRLVSVRRDAARWVDRYRFLDETAE
jgi:hypothetical protein